MIRNRYTSWLSNFNIVKNEIMKNLNPNAFICFTIRLQPFWALRIM